MSFWTVMSMSEAAQQPDEEDPYQVMPDLDVDQFERLKEDIEANGVEYPIIVDGDIVNGDGDVIDGHHRLKAWVELGRDPRDIPKRIVDKPEPENYHRAFRANLLRRDLADGTKRTVVKQYLLEHPDRVGEDDNKDIASDLGVSNQLVGRAIDELRENGNGFLPETLSTDEKKELVREYVDENPDESNREVAENVDCDVSHVSVGNWRPEDDASGDDGSEVAQEEDEKVAAGETTPDRAHETAEEQQDDDDTEEDTEEEDNSSDSDRNSIEQFTSQQTDEWSSPPDVVRPLNEAIGGFDLDPCSGAEQSPFADETYTEDDDGLAQEWFGSVWVNPPYSDMSSWVDKATAEAVCDGVETVVFLCKGDSSTQWWQTAAADATLITAIDGRLSFGDGENSAPFPSHIVVFGEVDSALVDALGEQGANLTVGWDDE